jgi:tricorn protease
MRTPTSTSSVLFLLASVFARAADAQVAPHAGMLRYPDVSAEHIVFVYAEDLWIVPRAGGVATPLASPPGPELSPRFSADGRAIAFVGSYDGGRDLYTIPLEGGIPMRVTHAPAGERLCDWVPEGRLLFFTNAFAGRNRQDQLFTVSAQGGAYEKLPVPYGAFGAISPSGEWLAYTPNQRDDATWKRYRGGMQSDIWLFHLKNKSARRVTDWEGTDTQPMWHRDQLYYLSDEGPSHRLNIWGFDPATERRRQVTRYDDFDVKWPSVGPGAKGLGEIVFQHGSDLVLLDLSTEKTSIVQVRVPGARAQLRPQTFDAARLIQSWGLSPSGKRAVVAARGDVWTLPAKEGSPRNLTRTSGIAERDPAWSPDGTRIAYFSDSSGEYELHLIAADGKGEPRRLTEGGAAFRANPIWSPDSRYIVFTDKTGSLFAHSIESGATTLVDKDPWAGDLLGEPPSWSHDGRWLAYSRQDERSAMPVIWLYEVETGDKHQVTAGMFADHLPTFDRKGDWLYFKSSRSFSPVYGEIDTSFVYTNSEVLLAVPLRLDVKSPFLAKSDEETGKKPDDDESDDDDENGKDKDKDDKDGDKQNGDKSKDGGKDDKAAKQDDKDEQEKPGKKKDKDDEPRARVEIALEDFEARAIELPLDAGRYGQLEINDSGALVYTRAVGVGEDADEPNLYIFDPADDEPEEQELEEKIDGFTLSGDGKKMLLIKDGVATIVDAKAGGKSDEKPDKVVTEGMQVSVDPRAEWNQVFQDAWRIMRDWFYDPKMHNVDWARVRDQYTEMLADCASRDDVGYVIREMISELNVGHAYYSGPNLGGGPGPRRTGLLGCDYVLDSGAWRIAMIHQGAAWDVDARNPLRAAGVDVREGDWLLAVNGVPLDPKKDPWAAFQGTAGQAITLTVSKKPTLDAEARDVVVKALDSETELRFRAWIEKNRAYVERKSGGRIGYVYVMSTGIDGQNDLVRQLFGQASKDALIIDERWNNGGQIPTRFIEMLNRPVTNYWARRDAKDWAWPPDGHRGPKCMLINGQAGSGGDAFPAYFKMMGLGKLIGTRTWGGLVGLSGNPGLIDGASVNVPTFGYYDKDGTWGIEGHGVEPDIVVVDDPSLMADGGDPQLDAAITHMQAELQRAPYVAPPRPSYPDRSQMGIADSDK